MDFDDTPEEAAFRAEARAWLSEHAAPITDATPRRSPWGGGDEAGHIRRAKAWQRALYDGGWAGVTWPKQYGGRGATSIQAAIFGQEQGKFDVSPGVFAVGIGMVGPTIIAHGTDGQKERFLDPMLRGEEVWCQLFSEPGAGSDLAGLGTRAVRDGDEFVVNGQKVWNSGAHYSDWGILLARTDPSAPKHRGITYFLVDMRTPGVDVRPLRQITGQAHFNEVFLSDVRIPVANVLGAVNDGWRVAIRTLANWRGVMGGGGVWGWRDVRVLARESGAGRDPVLRQELAAAFTRFELTRFLGYRAQTALSQGKAPGPEVSIMKLFHSQSLARTGDLVMAMQGVAATLAAPDAPRDGFWLSMFLNQWASRIGGGTDQVQRNIIGERVLGLPKEPSTDRDRPWNER
jgi:alkylation response protein AidB-like acyl-CoA dehydrogenase